MMSIRPLLLTGLFCLTFGVMFAARGSTTVKIEHTDNGLNLGDHFGASVSLEGDLAVIGVPDDDVNLIPDAGHVEIFTRGEVGWGGSPTLLFPPENHPSGRFGSAVLLQGTTLLVAEPGTAGGGMVHVYEQGMDLEWVLAATLSTNETALGDGFGSALAMEGDLVFIGAPNTPGGGAVYVFERDGDSWTRNQKVVSTDIDEGDYFGAALAVHNGLLAVGAPGREDEAGSLTDSGAVYLFTLDSSLWQQNEVALPAIADQRSSAAFGAAVGLRDNLLLVGAPKEDDPLFAADHGAAYVLSYDGFDWLQDARLLMPDSPLYTAGAFGSCVLLGDDYAVIGAPAAAPENAPVAAGAVVTFYYDYTEGWTVHQVLRDEPGRKQAALGSAIAISSNDLLVGAPQDRELGSARHFHFDVESDDESDKWVLDFAFFQPTADGGPNKKLGLSIATSGGMTVAGQPSDVTWGSNVIGSVYVYENAGATQVAKLLPPAWAAMPGQDYFDVLQNFGTEVAANLMDGEGVIAVTSTAGVFVYRVTGRGTELEARLEIPLGGSSAPFPPDYTLAISGETILVGNPYELFGGKELGAVHVFVKEGTAWRRQAILRGTQDRGAFGAGLAIEGDTAVIGAPANAPSNAAFSAAYVFTRSGVTWTQRRQLTSPVAALDSFGQDVAVKGRTLAITVPNNPYGSRLLIYDGAAATWTLKQTLTGDLTGIHLGTSLGFDGQTIVAGLNGPGFFYGGAVTYAQRDGLWKLQDSHRPTESTDYHAFGQASAVSGPDIAIGSADDDSESGVDAGSLTLIQTPGSLELYDGTLLAGRRVGDDGSAELELGTRPGELVQGVQALRYLTIYNGTASRVSDIVITADGPDSTGIVIDQLQATALEPGQSTMFRLGVMPPDSSLDATLHISATGEPTLDISLIGTALANAPTFELTQQPHPDNLLQEGGSLLLKVAVSAPPGAVQYRWLKDGKTVPGATGPELLVPHVNLTDAGIYEVVVLSLPGYLPGNTSTLTSEPARVVVVGQPPTGTRWLLRGSSLALRLPIAGPDYSVEWQGTYGPLPNGGPISGAQTPTLRISRLREEDFQDYTPVVTLGSEPQLWFGSLTVNEIQRAGPSFFYTDLGTWTVGEAGSIGLNLDEPPSPGLTFTATGLPPGLILNSRTGLLSGTPTREGLYNVRLTVSNRYGRSTQVVPVQVYPFNGGDEIAGAYTGLLERDPTLNDTLGGSVKIDLTRNGVCTGRVTFGSIITSFVCQLDSGYKGAVILRSPDKRWLYDLRLSLDTFTNRFTGTITHDHAHFTPTSFIAQRAEQIEHLSGYYTGLLRPVEPQPTDDTYPQGAAFSSARVSDNGTVIFAGRLADGAVLTASTASGYFGQAPLHLLLYNGLGSFQGTLLIQRTTEFFENDYNILGGTFSWLKKPNPSPKETSYAAGIPLHDLQMLGFRYFPPVEGSIVLALDPEADNAQITFEDANIGDASLNPDSTFTINASHQALLPTVNETGLKLKVEPATGIFSGEFTLKDPDPLNPLKMALRKASFAGVLIPRLDAGFGNFQLPQLRAVPNKLPPTLSGNLVLEKAIVE